MEEWVDLGKYFTINKARQFGKSTMLYMPERTLREHYIVISLSFEAADDLFESRYLFVEGLVCRIAKKLRKLDVLSEIQNEWSKLVPEQFSFEGFNEKIPGFARISHKKLF